MAKKIDDKIINQIPILYAQYQNKSQVARELGITPSTVSKYLMLYEAAPQERKQRVKITEELVKQINVKYCECRNMSQVARELGISPSTVKNHLTEENLKLKDQEIEDRDALFFYIIRLFGIQSQEQPVSKWNITQMQKFKTSGMPYRGQLLALKYFYEVEKNTTEKSKGSIGIIPFIWQRSKDYYEKQAKKADDITASIQKQLEKDRAEIKITPGDYFNPRRKKKTIDLNSIEEG